MEITNHNIQSPFKSPTIYEQPHNESTCEKLESVQYNVALAITGAIEGTFH